MNCDEREENWKSCPIEHENWNFALLPILFPLNIVWYNSLSRKILWVRHTFFKSGACTATPRYLLSAIGFSHKWAAERISPYAPACDTTQPIWRGKFMDLKDAFEHCVWGNNRTQPLRRYVLCTHSAAHDDTHKYVRLVCFIWFCNRGWDMRRSFGAARTDSIWFVSVTCCNWSISLQHSMHIFPIFQITFHGQIFASVRGQYCLM